MENYVLYFLYLLCGLSLFFVFVRGSVIDLKTQYVPNNIVIPAYTISILYTISISIYLKSWDSIASSLIGFLITFLIPYIFIHVAYYIKYYSLKRKFKKNGLKLEIEEDSNKLKENPKIDKKFYFIIYGVALFLLIVTSIVGKRYYLLIPGISALLLELLLGKAFAKYCVIEFNNAETEIKKAKSKEKTLKEQIEDSLDVGVGDGDIILFGALGIMFGFAGFVAIIIYSVFAQMIITILFSIIKKINPFKYQIPYIPAMSIGILIFVTGFDKYLLNIFNILNTI